MQQGKQPMMAMLNLMPIACCFFQGESLSPAAKCAGCTSFSYAFYIDKTSFDST